MIFLDTNVIIDVLDDKRQHHHKSLMILSAIQKGVYKACITTQTIIDASFICVERGDYSVELFRGAIRTLSNILAIRSITDDDIKYANNSPINDYEDAAQLSCALRRGCDAIVTSDKKYNKYTKVKTYTVEAFYDLIFKQ